MASCLRDGLNLILFLLSGLVPAAHSEPQRVALVTSMPITRGTWGPLAPHDALQLAAGTILGEYLSATPGLQQLDWTSTAGTAGIVRSGLYIFQAENPWTQWRELVPADIFADFQALASGEFTVEVHARDGTTRKTVQNALARPKEAVATLVTSVFERAGLALPPSAQAELCSPEAKDPKLFLAWAAWIDHSPNMYNDNPWQHPNEDAARIIQGDPDFMRGMAWALPMRLQPVMARSGSGTLTKRPANPVDFDNHVLALLNTKYARHVIPAYRERLQDPVLIEDSLKVLAASEVHFDSADPGKGEEDEIGVSDVKAVRQVKTTPLIRRNVCLALSGNRNPKVVGQLLTVLAVDETPTVREAAAESLGGWPGDPKVVDGLDKATREDADAAVRLAAFRSLGAGKVLTEDRLARALSDAATSVKSFAFSWLAGQKGAAPKVRQLLLDALRTGEDALRTQVLGIAGNVFENPDELVEPVKRALASAGAEERRASLRLLRQCRIRSLIPDVENRLDDPDPEVRSLAVRIVLEQSPEKLDAVLARRREDPDAGVRRELAAGVARHGDERHKGFLEGLLQSGQEDLRHAASNALYRVAAKDRKTIVRSMLGDPSMRANFAAIRVIAGMKEDALLSDLLWAAEKHGNEYVRVRALRALDRMNHPSVRDMSLRCLDSPYWVIRLHAADILSRRAAPEDERRLKDSLDRNPDRWLQLAIEDALCRSRSKPVPERTRLRLGQREHLEGGELPNGWQLWQGNIPADPAVARKLVDEGYRFGRVIGAPPDNSLWAMFTWEDSKGKMDAYILHLRQEIGGRLLETAPLLNHLMLFDEPHVPFGGNGQDKVRAFLLESGRPDLLAVAADEPERLPADLRPAFFYWSSKALGELSNSIVGICRMTLGRQFPDLKFFPQTMTYFGGASADAFDRIDTDGDYSWRYDNSNLFGHYGKSAVMRAIHPGQPVCMVTWMGWIHPSVIALDRVFTDTRYPDGPWRPRGYMGTRAALALYAGGVETGFFNHVGYDPMGARGKDIGGIHTFPLTPFSQALTDVIRGRMMGGDKAFWERRQKEIEGEVTAEKKPVKADDALGQGTEDDEAADFLSEAEGKKRVKIEDIVRERYEAERQKHFMNAMTGCSWMNIFNCDVARAMSNLPRAQMPSQPTLLLLARGTRWDSDGPTFPMPAAALAAGFDLCPNFDCAPLVDLLRYDTILVCEGPDGVTSSLVRQINHWLKTRSNGLLYVCGDLNTRKAVFPELTFDALTEQFLWEGSIQASATPLIEEDVLDANGKPTGRKRSLPPRIGEFETELDGGKGADEGARTRLEWAGDVQPLITRQGKTVLARWKTPPEVRSLVLFDGAVEAGPGYTEALERIFQHIDRERGARIERNRYWGHVSLETSQFLVDVATSGYHALQAARPRPLQGVDIITGVIHPTIRHGECALILKDYVGPYAGGKGDWAVMASSALEEMTVPDGNTLRIRFRGVARVTHIGEQAIAVRDAAEFEAVENPLRVWERLWQAKKAFHIAEIPGGTEMVVTSEAPVEIRVVGK